MKKRKIVDICKSRIKKMSQKWFIVNFFQLIEVESVELKKRELTKEGAYVVENGSHEFNVYEKAGVDGATAEELKVFLTQNKFFTVL